MPSNSGGLSLDLALYPSKPVGARLEFHRERYDRLVEPLEKGKSAFGTEQPTSKHTYDLRGYEPTEQLVLGVLEWQVTLWRHVELVVAGEVAGVGAGEVAGGAAPVRGAHTHELHNTIDAYAKLDLRNQVGQPPTAPRPPLPRPPLPTRRCPPVTPRPTRRCPHP